MPKQVFQYQQDPNLRGHVVILSVWHETHAFSLGRFVRENCIEQAIPILERGQSS